MRLLAAVMASITLLTTALFRVCARDGGRACRAPVVARTASR
jgi:hypothetical protein